MARILMKINLLEIDEYALHNLVAYVPDGAFIEQVKLLMECKAELERLGCKVRIDLRNLAYAHHLRTPRGFTAFDFTKPPYDGWQPPRCEKCRAVAVFFRSLPDPNPATTLTEYECFNQHRWTVEKVWD